MPPRRTSSTSTCASTCRSIGSTAQREVQGYAQVLRARLQGVGKRVFGVSLQGRTVVDNLDVFAQVGPFGALDYVYEDVEVEGGQLDIGFSRITEYPCIAAIAIEGDGVA